MSARRESFQTPFSLRAIEKEAKTTMAPKSGSNSDTAMVAGGVAELMVLEMAAFIVGASSGSKGNMAVMNTPQFGLSNRIKSLHLYISKFESDSDSKI